MSESDRPEASNEPPLAPELETFELERPEPGGGPGGARSSFFGPLFLVPLGLVLAAVLLYGFLNWMLGAERGPEEYLQEMLAGGTNARNQAFYGLLTSMIELQRSEELDTLPAAFDQELARAFDRTAPEEEKVRTALAYCLTMMDSELAYERVEDMVLEARADGGHVESSTPLESLGLVELQHLNPLTNGLRCLGRLGDPRAVPLLVDFLEVDDPGLRGMAAYALGGIDDPAVVGPLSGALEDGDRDVRRNAALALARRGDARGKPVLVEMLNPDAYQGYADATAIWQHVQFALFALGSLQAEDLDPAVRALVEDERAPPAVQSFAMRWLERSEGTGWPASGAP